MAIANTNTGWINGDGLRVKFPQDAIVVGKAGTYSDLIGSVNITEFDVGYAAVALGTSATNPYVLDFDAVLPVSSAIEKVEFYVTTAWAGASMTLDFGLVKRTDFASIVDADGLLAAVPTTIIDLAGNLVVGQAAGSYPDITTYSGAVIGTALSFDSVVCVNWNTAVPTAGAGKLKIYWRMPGA